MTHINARPHCIQQIPATSVLLHPIPAGVWAFPTPPRNSLTPTGCSPIQLSSDTVYLAVASDPTGLGLGSTRPLPPPTPQRQTPIASPDYALGFWPTGYSLKVPRTPSVGSINLLELLTELSGTFYLLRHKFVYLFVYLFIGHAEWHVGFYSPMRNRTCAPCIGSTVFFFFFNIFTGV